MTERTKYPRTFHLPWSPGASDDDKILTSTNQWDGMEVVITEKMDGSNCTWYRDYLHGRSLETEYHPQWSRVRALHASIAPDIPDNLRLCGENLTAVHSIEYNDLPSCFLIYSIWDEHLCLSWDDTVEWCSLLGLCTVPVLYRGQWSEPMCRELCVQLDTEKQEGLVVRPASEFPFEQFKTLVGKYVRAAHVTTSAHWKQEMIRYNSFR